MVGEIIWRVVVALLVVWVIWEASRASAYKQASRDMEEFLQDRDHRSDE